MGGKGDSPDDLEPIRKKLVYTLDQTHYSLVVFGY
jgi:hypothetical protein